MSKKIATDSFYMITNHDHSLYYYTFTERDTVFMTSDINYVNKFKTESAAEEHLSYTNSNGRKFLSEENEKEISKPKLQVAKVVVTYTIHDVDYE